MTKSIQLLFLFNFLFQNFVYAQSAPKELVITHHKTSKKIIIDPNKPVKIGLIVNTKNIEINGNYKIVNDSTLSINKQIIPISQIQYIKTESEASRNIGVGSMGAGIIIAISGGLIINMGNESKKFIIHTLAPIFGGLVLSTGAVLSFTGLGVYYLHNKRDTKKTWRLSIN